MCWFASEGWDFNVVVFPSGFVQSHLNKIYPQQVVAAPVAALLGQFLSRGFVVFLRKSIPQNHNLKSAAELAVKYLSFFRFCVIVSTFVFFCLCLL